ncbi:hypothetical protein [Pedobacter nanyangensis]|uniref:hypothetical protein n=1 Tax=Pedobacter nanyangensis TaxID=1562389 RepID=UPI000DE310DA|nr:hypothetical protein [Pedobacter nanyangensis]
MHQVTGEYPDYHKHSNTSSFYLNADQAFNPFTWQPPIHWTGVVGNKKVQFKQISSSGANVIDYDWNGFPDELSVAIPYIVDAINKAMRVMD